MKNWRVINNNKIQTYYSYVWLWDNVGGVAVLVKVPSRPWTKLSNDFKFWMMGEEGEETPEGPMLDGAYHTNPDGSVTRVEASGADEDVLIVTTGDMIATYL